MPTGVYPRPFNSVVERLWSKLNQNGPIPAHRPDLGPCWVFTGGLDAHGYGQINDHGKVIKTHHVLLGKPPAGLVYDHLCSNRACGRPSHLEAVTQGENVRRTWADGRQGKRKTHCLNGHPLDESNTRINKNGRSCKECQRRRWREWNARVVARKLAVLG